MMLDNKAMEKNEGIPVMDLDEAERLLMLHLDGEKSHVVQMPANQENGFNRVVLVGSRFPTREQRDYLENLGLQIGHIIDVRTLLGGWQLDVKIMFRR